mmetsp:Transcript_19165/g.34680  ORF Transcript_19165/g.34680 Transcript_19165/m.34680 type:complete len:218 (-) Transcript_19165:506-1159(-)
MDAMFMAFVRTVLIRASMFMIMVMVMVLVAFMRAPGARTLMFLLMVMVVFVSAIRVTAFVPFLSMAVTVRITERCLKFLLSVIDIVSTYTQYVINGYHGLLRMADLSHRIDSTETGLQATKFFRRDEISLIEDDTISVSYLLNSFTDQVRITLFPRLGTFRTLRELVEMLCNVLCVHYCYHTVQSDVNSEVGIPIEGGDNRIRIGQTSSFNDDMFYA